MITRRQIILLAMLSGGSLLSYLLSSCIYYRCGYPLDDAWIHQTYARNLVEYGEWAYIPGKLSSGSTSPLWTILLSIGYFLRINSYVWSNFLGWIFLLVLSIGVTFGLNIIIPEKKMLSIFGGIMILFEWHFVWAAGSGMETLLSAVLILCVLSLLIAHRGSWILMGFLIGISVWVRPDGVTLLFPAFLTSLLVVDSWRAKIKANLELISGFGVLFIAYLYFNKLLAGTWMPSTFYAKQVEYASLRLLPLWVRLFQLFSLPLVGVGAVLLPGFLYSLIDILRRKNWAALAGILWMLGFIGLYVWRLPVTYQHGRYLMPIMPVYLLWGLAGLIKLLTMNQLGTWKNVVEKSWVISTGIVLIIFWLLGLIAYRRDVAFIESEMVNVANWVEQNTGRNALIAAHDIGALGYFSGRDIVDLAGLITPDVIPFIRDEEMIKSYINKRGANYLVTFPGWYPILTEGASPIYVSGGKISLKMGGENMSVYRWPIENR
jgi:hypothetical protein